FFGTGTQIVRAHAVKSFLFTEAVKAFEERAVWIHDIHELSQTWGNRFITTLETVTECMDRKQAGCDTESVHLANAVRKQFWGLRTVVVLAGNHVVDVMGFDASSNQLLDHATEVV